MKNLLFSLIVLMVFSGCKKDLLKPKHTISGKVFRQDTEIPLAGVSLTMKRVKDGMLSSSRSIIAESTTDANGNYTLEYLFEDDVKEHTIELDLAFYFDNIYFLVPNLPENAQVDMTLQPHSYLQFKVKNEKPENENDLMHVRHNNIGLPYEEISLKGVIVDTTFTVITGSNQLTRIQKLYRKNGIWESHFDSIYCAAFDTSHYEINY